MKKYFSILLVLMVALVFGVKGVNAKITLDASKWSCKEDTELTDGVKWTTCDIVATNDTEQAYTDTVTVKVTYYKPSSFSKFEVTSPGSGLVSNENQEAGTFQYTFGGNIPAGDVTLFTIRIAADPQYNGRDCGASIAFVDAGENYTNTGSDPVPAANTGASIPVAIIAIGAATGLAVYAGTSRKTKMHRI